MARNYTVYKTEKTDSLIAAAIAAEEADETPIIVASVSAPPDPSALADGTLVFLY